MYMTGTLQNIGHKLLAIYCMPDHCHILIGLNPRCFDIRYSPRCKSGLNKMDQ
ncbi:MAG: hypothetical protein R3B47_09710 [Bacteroidia bacterium]